MDGKFKCHLLYWDFCLVHWVLIKFLASLNTFVCNICGQSNSTLDPQNCFTYSSELKQVGLLQCGEFFKRAHF